MSIDLSCIDLNGRTVSLDLRDGRIAAITPAKGAAMAVAMPLPVDPHVHLDKTFTISRCTDIKPGLFGAIDACHADAKRWTAEDLRARATKGLTEAYANGLSALRSHVDWVQPDAPLAWAVLNDLARDWQGKLGVQLAALVPLDLLSDESAGNRIASQVAADGGVLGCFAYCNDDINAKLENVFRLAAHHGLPLDFHVDEGLSTDARGFDAIVALTAKYAMSGRVLCGHVCALSIRPQDDAARVMDAAAKAGVSVTVLPTTNLYLQDMQTGRSPRLRGLAPVLEMRAAGVNVVLGADNVADPFYPRGCYDALDILRLASLASHLEPADWVTAISSDAARAIGHPASELAVGAAADFLLVDGTDWNDALRNPRARRRVIRAGQTQSIGKDAA